MRGSPPSPAIVAVLALVLLSTAPAVAGEVAPTFQIREIDAERSARTLHWLAAAPEERADTRVWVFLTDKNVFDSESCDARLDALEATLDPHAARRRHRSMGTRPVDFHDLPVADVHVAAIEALGARVHRRSRWLNAVSVEASLDVLERVASEPFVAWLEPVRGYRFTPPTPDLDAPAPPPSTRRVGDIFDYGTSRDQLAEIGVIDAHNLGYSGAGVRVAMLDTGFYYDHEAFATCLSDGRLIAQWDFIQDDGDTQNDGSPADADQHNHGTYTWSTTGGLAEGEVIGPAYGAEFLLAKTEEVYDEHSGEEDNWVAALEWADTNGADVISSSLGWIDWYTWADLDGNTAPSTIAVDLAVGRGIVVCNSAGNEGTQDWHYVIVPADADSVISVGAVDEFNVLADFSSHGPTDDGRTKPEVVARGVSTYCAIPPELGASYWWLSGTSLSCPLVSGCAALVVEARPAASAAQIRLALMATADNASTPDNDRGWGRIDVAAAIEYLAAASTPATGPLVASGLRATPNPTRRSTRIEYRLPATGGDADLELYGANGRLVRHFVVTAGGGGVSWDGRDADGQPVAPGVYLVRLTAGEWRATTKVVVQP